LGEALEPLWRQQRREIEVHYLEPTAASPTTLRAELLPSHSPVTDPQVARVRTSEILGRQSHQEIIWFDAGGRTQHRERQFFGATLTWDRCLRDCDAKVEKPVPGTARSLPYCLPPWRAPKAFLLAWFTDSCTARRELLRRIRGNRSSLPGA